MIYRVRHVAEDGECLGYSYHGSSKEAKDSEGTIVDTASLPANKKELLKLLRFWAGHADNG